MIAQHSSPRQSIDKIQSVDKIQSIDKSKEETVDQCIVEDILEDVSSANFDGLNISN